MATLLDTAVRRDGKTYRIVGHSNGMAGLFDATGTLVQTLAVDGSAPNHRTLPTLLDEGGTPVALARVPKPCSCTGGVWKMGADHLRKALA